jgi:glycosyltransferase involved in cell wall biosynthesis
MASGSALIAANTGGLPELVGDAGILFVPGDVGALTRAITALADSEAERARLANLGRTQAAAYDTAIIGLRLGILRSG